MDSKEYKELMQAYNNVYEQRIGVPLDKATDDAAARKLQQIVPKGEKVYIPKSGLQKAHYEPEGELVGEQQVINPPKSGGLEFPFRSVDGLIRGGAASGIPDIPDNINRTKRNMDILKQGMVKKQTPKPTTQVAHYEPEGELVEDLEQRRKQLAQRQREGIEGFKERISARVKANRKRLAKRKEREQIKAEIKREVAKEAVGDPISPNSVFKLSDPVHQKNIQSAAKPAGPPPMKPAAPKPKQQSGADRFVKRMVGSTMLSPL